MRELSITRAAIDPEGRILVYPNVSPGRDFEQIHRAARGAYWDASERAIFTAAPVTSSCPEILARASRGS